MLEIYKCAYLFLPDFPEQHLFFHLNLTGETDWSHCQKQVKVCITTMFSPLYIPQKCFLCFDSKQTENMASQIFRYMIKTQALSGIFLKLNKVWFFIYKNGFFSFCARIKSVSIWIFRIILHVLSPQIYYISSLFAVSIGSLFVLILM